MRFLAALLLLSGPAHAQLSSVGALLSIPPPGGTSPVRWPDVAFSAADDVFLAVSGAGNVQGQYVTASGTAEGSAFVVNAGAVFGQAPRVAWSEGLDAFLVTWHESIGNDTRIRGRLIRHGQAALTSDFDISPFGTNWEMGAAAAWSTGSDEFLVGWQDRATTTIHVQRISGTGAQLGNVITLEATLYARDPAIAYDPHTDRFLVAYGGCVGNDDCFVHAQRVQAGTGALVGAPIVLEAPIRAGYVPELAYDARERRFLAVWFRSDPAGTGLFAKTVDADGLTGPLVSVSAVASYDANSLAWNPVSGTFVVVTHSSTAQDLALELNASGTPAGPGVLFGAATASGNFNPRVCASTRTADFVAVTSDAFASLGVQRLTTLARPPAIDAGVDAGSPDAGVPAVDAGLSLTPDAGSPPAPDGGTAIVGTGSCGCTSGTPGLALLAMVLLLLSSRRAEHARGRGGVGVGAVAELAEHVEAPAAHVARGHHGARVILPHRE